ncbi:MAG: hypothetical protein DME65_06620 [Verrucomicrobia bacterium]|nr:MAG: hypothetical protein DME65_06620 [Verrucomicrobiota bacterium]
MSTPVDMVELRDVHMQFEEKQVLDGVSLKIEPQERLVIMGQSGSGKSTILRLILGTLRPDSGSIFFKRFEITRLRRRKLQQVRRHIGMVYQYSALLSSRNVRDNVALPLEELTDKPRSRRLSMQNSSSLAWRIRKNCCQKSSAAVCENALPWRAPSCLSPN